MYVFIFIIYYYLIQVRTNSESALVVVLKMRENDALYLETSKTLDNASTRDLSETSKALRKLASTNDKLGKDIDDTLLT